jgi:hypothetical protein
VRSLGYWYDSAALSNCTETFIAAVGTAPTVRLRPLERRVRAACRSFERGNALDRRAFAGEPELRGEATAVYAARSGRWPRCALLLSSYHRAPTGRCRTSAAPASGAASTRG